MPAIERSILVNAPVGEVFAFVADYRNTIRYQRHFSRFDPVGSPTYGLGLTVEARGHFKGFPIRTKLRVTEFVDNELIVSKSVEGLRSEAIWSFAPENGGTRVTFSASYAWPIPVLSGAIRRMVTAELASMTESSLRELKRLVERRHQEAGGS